MPKILSCQPRWLDHNTPAFDFFQPPDKNTSPQQHDEQRVAPPRKIAHRGSEVFTVVGNELRWSDLGVLKDAGEGEGRYEHRHGHNKPAYKVGRGQLQISCRFQLINSSGSPGSILQADSTAICFSIWRSSSHFDFTYLPYRGATRA